MVVRSGAATPVRASDANERASEWRRLVGLLLGVSAVLLLGISVATAQAFDAHTFWAAGRHFVHGQTIYPNLHSLRTFSPTTQQSFIYPPPMAAVFAPWSLLPYSIAKPLYLLALVLAVGAAVRLAGVRDWRCYAAAFASPAVLSGISVGTVSPFLLLVLVFVWRWRDHPYRSGVAAATAVAAKLFLWPLLIWLAFSGRRRSSAVAAGLVVVSCAAAWARLGYDGLTTYPELLHRISGLEGPHGDGLLWWAGGLTSYEIAAPVAASIVALTARRLRAQRSLAIAVAAALLASPILWVHYLSLLPAMAALWDRELSIAWLMPLVLWVPLLSGSHHLTVAAVALVTVACAGRGVLRRGRTAAAPLPVDARAVVPVLATPLDART